MTKVLVGWGADVGDLWAVSEIKRVVEGGFGDGVGVVFHIAALRACTLRI